MVNVVDLMKLQPHTEHPHGLTDEEYDTLFTKDKPIIFAYHGYPTLIHELTYRRHNKNLHVRGYKEEGTITTPFDMRVLNDIDRFDLVIDTVAPSAPAGQPGRLSGAEDERQAGGAPPVYPGQRRRPAGGPELEVGGLTPKEPPICAGRPDHGRPAFFCAAAGIFANFKGFNRQKLTAS